MNRQLLPAIILSFCVSAFSGNTANASVGGPQLLSFLGIDTVSHSAYLLKSFYDESDNPHLLLRYNYQTRVRDTIGECERYASVSACLAQAGLSELFRPDSLPNGATVAWGSPEQRWDAYYEVNYDLHPVDVSFAGHTIRLATCYHKQREPVITGRYLLPGSGKELVIVRWFGLCYESGYDTDTLVILPHLALANDTVWATRELPAELVDEVAVAELQPTSIPSQPANENPEQGDSDTRFWLFLVVVLVSTLAIWWYQRHRIDRKS